MKLLYSLLLVSGVCLADNTINIVQIGNYNTISVTQEGSGHTAGIKLGAVSDVDYTSISITQQGLAKTANVDIKSGINNSVAFVQEGIGNHYASITNLTGSGNNITLNQSGSGTHSFVVDATNTNNGNTITAAQSGNVGADKAFTLNLNGATGASVNVQQTSTVSNTGSMAVQCNPCGAYSYIRQ
jgi:hypothetical protein